MALETRYAGYYGATFPTEAQVLDGVEYTDGVVDYTGTLDPGAGGTVPDANDVRLGVNVGQGSGTLRVPAVEDVRIGKVFDANDSLTGTLDVDAEANLPAVDDVLEAVAYGSTSQLTGTYATVAVGDVQESVTFGPSESLTGTFVVPTQQQVMEGVGYGEDGTEFTGILDPGGGATDYPAPSDVRDAIEYAFGAAAGILVSPDAGDVRLGVSYGANGEYVGTWDGSTSAPGLEGWIG